MPRMIPTEMGLRWTCMLWAILAVAGCATPEMRVASVSVASRRVAALPSEGVVFDYDFQGRKIINSSDTLIARRNFDDAINDLLRQHGGRAFPAAALGGLPHAFPFHLWFVSSLKEIRDERLGRAHETHETVGDWKFSSSLGSWRAVLDADYILVSQFIDGRNTTGRELAAHLLGGPVTVPDAIACLVHLETARIVWCNYQNTTTSDLTVRADAEAQVDSLLGEMLMAGDMAPVEPPPIGSASTRPTPAEDPGPPPTPANPASKLQAP
jgi:hypothetical protein